MEWYPIYGPKSLFKFGEKRPIVCYCTREQKINFEGFTQNGCYGNRPQPFEVVFYSIDANTSCSFTKQDLTVKQAYCASFCFVLCNEPIRQIIPCHVTEVKLLRFFWFISPQFY